MKGLSRVLIWEGLILLVFGVLAYVFVGTLTLFALVDGLLGVVSLAVGWALDFGGIRETVSRRSAKYGANALIYTVVFLGILVFINAFASAHAKKFDLTKAGVNTLTDQTLTVIKNLPEKTEIVGFFKTGESKPFEKLAERYGDASRGKIKVEVLDPDVSPGAVKKYAVHEPNSVAVSCQGRTNITMDVTEQGITTALLKISAPPQGAIYMLEGHGELGLESHEERGMAALKGGLENENIKIKPLLIRMAGGIPPDASLIIIAGPTQPLSAEEVTQLGQYLDKGGRLMVLLDPFVNAGLDDLLAKYGVKVENDVVVDMQLQLLAAPIPGYDPIVVNYGPHEITKKIGENPTIFHVARSLKVLTEGRLADVTVDPLLNTREQSWGETDFAAFNNNETPKMDPGKDLKGPLVLGVAVERKVGDKKARLVVIGNASFADNRWVGEYFNANLFLNSINWLTGTEQYISLRPHTFTPDVFQLTDKDRSLIFFASVFLAPQIVVMLGIGVALRRKR
jgi:ABC-type uncharacterized transport system involved in gliding motility auxiliary subunit